MDETDWSPLPRPASNRGAQPQRLTPFVWLLFVLLGALVAPYVAEQVQYGITHGRLRAEVDTARSELPSPALADISRQFALVAKAIGPSVVHVDTVQRVRSSSREQLIQFFDAPPQRAVQGQGSGVVIDESGYVLTNAHVVEGAEQILVRLNDYEVRVAEKVGSDAATDLAVLKIAPGGLIAAEWGDSDTLEVGSLVWAVGNPFGLDRSVTFGIISAKNRRVDRTSLYQDFLQTDAAVNPGNSGGPLVDCSGKIVGINTAIVGRAYQGVSFSIPSSIARVIYEQLRSSGKVVRGFLGVKLGDLDAAVARSLGLSSPEGGLLEEVYPDTPAAKANLQPGDVIVRWNGHAVADAMSLRLLIAGSPVGSTAMLEVLRNGTMLNVDVQVEEFPSEPPRRRR